MGKDAVDLWTLRTVLRGLVWSAGWPMPRLVTGAVAPAFCPAMHLLVPKTLKSSLYVGTYLRYCTLHMVPSHDTCVVWSSRSSAAQHPFFLLSGPIALVKPLLHHPSGVRTPTLPYGSFYRPGPRRRYGDMSNRTDASLVLAASCPRRQKGTRSNGQRVRGNAHARRLQYSIVCHSAFAIAPRYGDAPVTNHRQAANHSWPDLTSPLQ
ncbi:hypothetical protein LZ30DRAFT_805072 [Colletotrichum cereale]|nr:hypothetical protein LZ30DRAFT_805072 [Colletotrichum cereale]